MKASLEFPGTAFLRNWTYGLSQKNIVAQPLSLAESELNVVRRRTCDRPELHTCMNSAAKVSNESTTGHLRLSSRRM